MLLVRVLLEATERSAAALGADRIEQRRQQFIREAGLEGVPLDDVHKQLRLMDFRRAVRAALRITGDPALGLHMGERTSTGSLDAFGALSDQCETLRDAMQTAMHYRRIATSLASLELQEQGDRATLRLTFPSPNEVEAKLGAEFANIGLLRAVRMYVAPDALPLQASFTYPAPSHHDEYRVRFGGRERFSQEYTGLEIDRSWLDRKRPGPTSALRAHLTLRADYLLAKANKEGSAAERVRRWLASQPKAARSTMKVVARELGTSERSLRRRLQDENVRFNELLEEFLAVRARQLLTNSKRSIQETAYELGFINASAFSRAFKRWTGKAPSDYQS